MSKVILYMTKNTYGSSHQFFTNEPKMKLSRSPYQMDVRWLGFPMCGDIYNLEFLFPNIAIAAPYGKQLIEIEEIENGYTIRKIEVKKHGKRA